MAYDNTVKAVIDFNGSTLTAEGKEECVKVLTESFYKNCLELAKAKAVHTPSGVTR